ncbi:unnamed protein product, partial [Ixodes hexagonus]
QVLNRHPPFGSQVLQAARSLPKYRLHINQEGSPGEDSATLTLSVEVGCRGGGDRSDSELARVSSAPVHLLVGDADDRLVLHQCISDGSAGAPTAPARVILTPSSRPAPAPRARPPAPTASAPGQKSPRTTRPSAQASKFDAKHEGSAGGVCLCPCDPMFQWTPRAQPHAAGPHGAASSTGSSPGASAAKRPCRAVNGGSDSVGRWQVPDFEAVSAALLSRYFPRHAGQRNGP